MTACDCTVHIDLPLQLPVSAVLFFILSLNILSVENILIRKFQIPAYRYLLVKVLLFFYILEGNSAEKAMLISYSLSSPN
jgi:hypothetical protein